MSEIDYLIIMSIYRYETVTIRKISIYDCSHLENKSFYNSGIEIWTMSFWELLLSYLIISITNRILSVSCTDFAISPLPFLDSSQMNISIFRHCIDTSGLFLSRWVSQLVILSTDAITVSTYIKTSCLKQIKFHYWIYESKTQLTN